MLNHLCNRQKRKTEGITSHVYITPLWCGELPHYHWKQSTRPTVPCPNAKTKQTNLVTVLNALLEFPPIACCWPALLIGPSDWSPACPGAAAGACWPTATFSPAAASIAIASSTFSLRASSDAHMRRSCPGASSSNIPVILGASVCRLKYLSNYHVDDCMLTSDPSHSQPQVLNPSLGHTIHSGVPLKPIRQQFKAWGIELHTQTSNFAMRI